MRRAAPVLAAKPSTNHKPLDQAITQHQAQNLFALRAKSQANADLSGALRLPFLDITRRNSRQPT
jgi:hypothetical protein